MKSPLIVEEQNFLTFLKFIREQGIDESNSAALSQAMKAFYEGGSLSDAKNPAKDTVAARPATGWLYDHGPFTWHTDTIFSNVTDNSSPLMEWLPTETFDAKHETIAHLSWIARKGWTGQDYSTFLHGLVTGACTYGPSTSWSGYEFQVGYGENSVSTDSLYITDFGLKEYEKTPTYTTRGTTNFPIDNDAKWAVARVGIDLVNHAAWNLISGINGEPYQWDGMEQVMTPGYVASHVIGAGKPVWSDPLTYDGSAITKVEDLLETIKALVRMIQKRARQRRWAIADGDMAIVLPSAHWEYILNGIACGGITGCANPATMTVQDWRQERNSAMQGGIGFGAIEVDTHRIPVIPEELLGHDGTDASGGYVTTGDVMILTRRVSGIPLWAQQHLNWNALQGWQEILKDSWTEQNGIVRVGWVSESQKCFYYFAEMKGRLVCRLMPLQARLSSVTVPTVLPNESENGWYGDNFYALEGASGIGTLVPWA